MSSSVMLRTTLDSCSQILVYPCEFIWKCMTDSVPAFLWPDSPLPSVMKAIFFSFPTLTAGVCSSPATLQLRPALCIDRRHWEKPISVALAAMNICATLRAALFPLQLPLSLQMSPIMLQCASSSGYIKSNFFRDEKLNMIVQMSSCPPRGIVMYTELVVGFNCDIYEMWESNICAPFLLCKSYPEDSFLNESESSINCGYNWWIDLSGSIFLSCKLVSLEAVKTGSERAAVCLCPV